MTENNGSSGLKGPLRCLTWYFQTFLQEFSLERESVPGGRTKEKVLASVVKFHSLFPLYNLSWATCYVSRLETPEIKKLTALIDFP